MSTYLFTWNPDKFLWHKQKEMIANLPNEKPIHAWKTTRIKNIGIGDTFLLMKLGNIPKNEKGIIGIGTIISNVYKDKDVIKNIEQTNFIDLEFMNLSTIPFISLKELESIDPNINWTPENNGNHIPNSTYEKIFNKINKNKDSNIFEKKIYFPVISEIIDLALTQQNSVHRDEIVSLLLEEHNLTLSNLAKNSNKTALFIAQNMVDWFSAELTKKSEIAAPWQDKYTRNKIKVNGREITNFSLEKNDIQDEIIPTDIIFKEGSLKQIQVNAYERNSQARKKCLEKHGYSCKCCGFNFEIVYGELGKNFIHVHHVTPLSQIKMTYILNPETDLIPVCANCHAMIHRKVPPYTIDEIQKLMRPKN